MYVHSENPKVINCLAAFGDWVSTKFHHSEISRHFPRGNRIRSRGLGSNGLTCFPRRSRWWETRLSVSRKFLAASRTSFVRRLWPRRRAARSSRLTVDLRRWRVLSQWGQIRKQGQTDPRSKVSTSLNKPSFFFSFFFILLSVQLIRSCVD